MTDHRPILIIIAGPPAAGKTTLARPLATCLGMPLFEKDAVKERLADALGAEAPRFRRPLGRASIIELYAIVEELLHAKRNVIIEGFFHHGVSEEELAPLAAKARSLLIHVTADENTLVTRYLGRSKTTERHPIHNTGNQEGINRDYLRRGVYEPLDLEIPQIFIDTTFGKVDPEEVAYLVRETLDIP